MTLLTPISTYYFTKSQFLYSKQFSNQLNGVFLPTVTTANLSHDSMWHAVSIFWATHWTYFRDLPAEYLPEQCVQWSLSVMGVNIGLIIFFFSLFFPKGSLQYADGHWSACIWESYWRERWSHAWSAVQLQNQWLHMLNALPLKVSGNSSCSVFHIKKNIFMSIDWTTCLPQYSAAWLG